MKISIVKMILCFTIVLLLSSCDNKVVVKEGEQAVRILFGKVNGVIKEPGIIKKTNFYEKIIIYPKSNQTCYSDKMLIPSKESILLYFKFKMVWNIADPAAFYLTLYTIEDAHNRFGDIIEIACRTIISETDFNRIKMEFEDKNKIINNENSSILNEILNSIKNHKKCKILKYHGINVVGIELIKGEK